MYFITCGWNKWFHELIGKALYYNHKKKLSKTTSVSLQLHISTSWIAALIMSASPFKWLQENRKYELKYIFKIDSHILQLNWNLGILKEYSSHRKHCTKSLQSYRSKQLIQKYYISSLIRHTKKKNSPEKKVAFYFYFFVLCLLMFFFYLSNFTGSKVTGAIKLKLWSRDHNSTNYKHA